MDKTSNTELVEENDKGNRAVGKLSLIVEICVVVVSVMWNILVSIYRLFIPVPKKSVKGEVVLITGAGHGLGKELALLYASEGATVVCLDINEENNKETIATMAKKGYPKAYAYNCDVTDYAKVHTVVDQIQKEVGDITILINNAGIMPTRPFLQQTKEQIEQTMNVNVLGYHWTMKAVLPTMVKNNYGHIVAICSLCGMQGLTNLVPYCCSKFGIRGLMSTLRLELDFYGKSQIKTTTVFPYIIDTGLAKKPKVRFPGLFPILPPSVVAKCVMSAQRQDVLERTVPREFVVTDAILHYLPYAGAKILCDFLDIRIEAE